MPFMDRFQDVVGKVLPQRNDHAPVSTSMSGGIGSGKGMGAFEDDMIVSKPTIIFHASQMFFNFLAMACFASVAAFQAKWGVGPSGLTGFALFVSIAGICLSGFMLFTPVIYERWDKFSRLARALKEVRVGFILSGCGTGFSLLIAFIVTISAWTEAGCKNVDNDPNADKGDAYKDGLSGWCSTKKAGSVFFWLAFGFWCASLVLTFLDWRSGRSLRPRDPPFTRPDQDDDEYDDGEGDEESAHARIPPVRKPTAESVQQPTSPFADSHRYSGGSVYSTPSAAMPSSTFVPGAPAASRPSMDAYGAFSDPPPSGFNMSSTNVNQTNTGGEGQRVSRTMQYADPYAAVRASIAGAGTGGGGATPPYEPYSGYSAGYR